MLFLLGRITSSFTPKYSQVGVRNFAMITPENSWRINCASLDLEGPMVRLADQMDQNGPLHAKMLRGAVPGAVAALLQLSAQEPQPWAPETHTNWFLMITGGKSTPKNPPKMKSSSERVFLNNFRWVPDSCHRKAGKSSRELFEKVRVNAVIFWYFGILGWVFRPLNEASRYLISEATLAAKAPH